jgi:quercetin dioxygenase-like cupin family protein
LADIRQGEIMRRFIVPLIALTIVGALTFTPRIAAQKATPPAGIELAPGVYAEVLAGIPSDRAEGQTLYSARFTFEPGQAIFPHSHPGTTLLSVVSGRLGWTLVQGTAYVIRDAASGASAPTETLSEPDDDVVLEPGDAIYYEDDVIHTARGAGDEPAIAVGTFLLTAGEPLLMPMDGMAMGGTPTP